MDTAEEEITQKGTNMKLETPDDQLIACAAHRYCLRRMTYMVEVCCLWIAADWDQFSDQTKADMIKETEQAIENNRAGMDCDVASWKALAQWMKEQE